MNKKHTILFKPSIVNLIIIAFSIALNVAGKYIAVSLGAPFWLDSIGTALCACLLGPVAGCLAGLSGFFIYQFIQPTIWIYAITCIPVSFCISILNQKMTFHDPFQLLSAGIFTAFPSLLVTYILDSIFRQGYTGNRWGDALIDMLYQNNEEALFAYMGGHVFLDIPDKILTLLIVFGLISLTEFLQKRKRRGE